MILIFFSAGCPARVRFWVLASARYVRRLWATLWGLWSPVIRRACNRSVGPCSPGRSVIVHGRIAQSSVVLAHQTKRRTKLIHGPTERLPARKDSVVPWGGPSRRAFRSPTRRVSSRCGTSSSTERQASTARRNLYRRDSSGASATIRPSGPMRRMRSGTGSRPSSPVAKRRGQGAPDNDGPIVERGEA